MANHSSVLVWRIPWTEKPGGLLSIGLQRVGHDWSDWARMHTWWRKGFLLCVALFLASTTWWVYHSCVALLLGPLCGLLGYQASSSLDPIKPFPGHVRHVSLLFDGIKRDVVSVGNLWRWKLELRPTLDVWDNGFLILGLCCLCCLFSLAIKIRSKVSKAFH